MDIRKEKVSFSNGLVWMLSHCSPKPCSSYRERYSVPKPKATWDNKLWRVRRTRPALRTTEAVTWTPFFVFFEFHGSICTHSSQLRALGDAILPGKAEDVWKIKGEVEDTAAGGRQVGLVEEDAHQETLHDRGDGERQQEKEDEYGVAVIQHLPTLAEKKRCTCCDGSIKVLFSSKQGRQSTGAAKEAVR